MNTVTARLGGYVKKVDLKKELKHLYQPSAREVVQVDVPAMNYLMIDGEGDPNTSRSFSEAVEVLFSISYALKFMVKKGAEEVDYGVMPLEGLWWADDMSIFNAADKSNWKWTLMIMQPSYITNKLVNAAMSDVRKKKNPDALTRVRFEPFAEGRSAQTMHIGPFSEEGPTIEQVHRFIHDCGSELSGKHHEIYLSDIRRGDPKKWKTIIRQSMK